MSRLVTAVGTAVALAATMAHAAPAITAVAPVRRRLLPGLSGIGRADHVALTFDDGPDPVSTPRFLDLLREERVWATFFLIGAELSRAPGVGADIAAAGHEVAVHGWRHRCLLVSGPRRTYDDIARTVDLVAAVTGQPPRWYRPPYGVLTTAALAATRRLDLTPVLWTAWGRDWEAGATADSIRGTVLGRLRGGGTVLLHDSDSTSAPGSWRHTLAALPALLDDIRAYELAVGPLAEHDLPRRSPTRRRQRDGHRMALANLARLVEADERSR
jgi:peptidoglycan/xylan/chitin deacetylase (PgdA/CDA1 family)